MERLGWAREIDPDFSITTDVITGFPGESREEFEQSVNFIRQAGFSGGHVFPYSERPGTPAIKLPGQVQSKERKVRAAEARAVIAASADQFAKRLIGKSGQVLWETSMPERNGFRLDGFCETYVRVTAWSEQDKYNVIDTVSFSGTEENCLTGDIIPCDK